MKLFDFFVFIFVIFSIIWLGYHEKQMQIRNQEFMQFAKEMNEIYSIKQ